MNTAESDALRVRFTTTGVMVVEGKCPHCGHDAMEHWQMGCKATRGDHCRMDPQKLARLALCLKTSGCDGYSHSLPCNDAYFEARRVGEAGRATRLPEDRTSTDERSAALAERARAEALYDARQMRYGENVPSAQELAGER